MSSRDYTKHLVSSTPPTNTKVGDEYYDPVTNKLYKKLAVNGTTVTDVEIAQNTDISIIQGVDLGQNATITAVNQFAQAAFNQANTASPIDQFARDTANSAATVNTNQNTAISIIQGVDLGQNATIIAVNQFAQAAYNQANTGGGATITNDNTTNANRFIVWDDVTSGSLSAVGVSSTKLYFNPSIGTLYATVFQSLSDESQKSNISIISNGLEIVENLRGVTFDWVESPGSSAGLIAQDVEHWLPQLVTTDDHGVKNLNYSGVIGALVEAVKTLSDRVKVLESK